MYLNIKKILIVLLFVLFQSTLSAENHLNELYKAHNYEALKNSLNSYSDKRSYEYQFFSAIFDENGENAKSVYEKIFNNSSGILKRYSAKKLLDYYYAKGYYDTAKKYQKYLIEKSSVVLKENSNFQAKQTGGNDKLFIQVGAFGLRENAEQLQNMLKTQNIKASIIEKKINGKTLHLVWIKGKNDFESTLNEANLIREKYDLDYRIIKN